MTFNDNDSLLCYVTQFKTLTININNFPPSVQHFKRNIQHSILHFDLNDIKVKFVIIHRSSKQNTRASAAQRRLANSDRAGMKTRSDWKVRNIKKHAAIAFETTTNLTTEGP